MAPIALILAGGAARGAYEVGVVQHIVEEVAKDLGRPLPLDIICGTSVGAINACALAAFADDHKEAVRRLVAEWTSLRVNDVVKVNATGIFGILRSIIRPRPTGIPSAFLDPAGLQRLVASSIPFERISENIASGKLTALTVSTTHIASGKTTVYVQRGEPGLPYWGADPTVIARTAIIGTEHALASAAIPFVFPPILLDGQYHCDGGLRQNVPLSPARRLGAEGVIGIVPKYQNPEPPLVSENVPPTVVFLLGKVLNALLLDRMENDLARLERITAMMEAGERAFGFDFSARLNAQLDRPDRGMRPIHTVLVRASKNIAAMAAETAHSPAFRARASGLVAAGLRRLTDGADESDLLSYILFDGEYARQLIDLGRADARARHAELCSLFLALSPK